MALVGIVSDTTACLPASVVKELHIRLVPLDVVLSGKVYRDGETLLSSEFYRYLERASKLPTTSPSSPATYLRAYREVAQQTDSILCITLTASLSGMYESARIAKELATQSLPHTRIEVLDCRTAGGAQGLVVWAAARSATAGARLAEVIQVAQQTMAKVHLIAFLDTLHYLVKGGRVPKVAALATSVLQIKPLMQILPLSGEATPLEKVRTKPKAVQRLVEIMAERVASAGKVHAVVMHTNNPGEAENLKDIVASRFACVEIYVKEFTLVMGAHTGPGLLGIAFYADPA